MGEFYLLNTLLMSWKQMIGLYAVHLQVLVNTLCCSLMLIAKVIQFVVFGPLRVSEKQVSLNIKRHSHIPKHPHNFTCSFDLLRVNFTSDSVARQSWGVIGRLSHCYLISIGCLHN